MTRRETWLILPLCGAFALGALSGCEDAESRERLEVQAKLDGASEKFRKAEFASVVSDLTPVTNGGTGQQAARGLLLSDSMRSVGRSHLSEARKIELEQRRTRELLRTNLAGLLRLDASATAMDQVSTEPLRSSVHSRVNDIDREIRDLERQLTEMEAPISDRQAEISRDEGEVERLQQQANDLFRKAMDLGHADGFGAFEEATALRREADQLERRIALVRIELEQDLQPQRDAAQMALEHARARHENAQETLRALDDFDRTYQEQVSNLRSAVAELRQQIVDAMKQVNAASLNDIEQHYEQAVSQFERAATEALRAAGSARDSGAARLTEARSYEALGSAHASRSDGLRDHASLLAAIIAAGPAVGSVEGFQSQLEAVRAKQREAIEHAKTAYESAINAIKQLSGRVEGADGYRQSLQNSLDLISGKDIEIALPSMEAIDVDAMDLPFDPSALEGLAESGGKEALLEGLDQMTFDIVGPLLQSMGVVQPGEEEELEEMRVPYEQALAAVRARVESGEITSVAQLEQAFMEEFMRILGMGG